jgi:type IV secretory pathway VirB3-like protein
MGVLSVILNIITLLVVMTVFYIARELYRTRSDKNLTASDVFNLMWTEPDTVTHSFYTNSKYGPIGNFYAYDWQTSPAYTTVEV